jgi:hypothetical protein
MARPGLDRHPKFRRLCVLLKVPRSHTRGYLELLWDTAYENGEPLIGDATDVALACDFPGDAAELVQALLACGGDSRTGFIEESPSCPGTYQVHDLYDHAPEYVRKRFDREAARKAAGKTLSEIRAEAAAKRWKSRATVLQTDASGSHLQTLAMQTDANGCNCPANGCNCPANGTPPAPAPAPAPNVPPATPATTPRKRPRDELFDAVVEVTGVDPESCRSHVGKVCKALRQAKPPYTAAEVRRLPSVLAERNWSVPITPGTIEKYAGWIRSPPTVPAAMDLEDRALVEFRHENGVHQ